MMKELDIAPGYWVTRDGRVFSTKRPTTQEIKRFPAKRSGHLRVTIFVDGKAKTIPVHVLVLHAFRGKKPNHDSVSRHLDGDKYNNHISNLVWGTVAENNHDKVMHGTTRAGQASPHTAKLTSTDVRRIRTYLSRGLTCVEIAAKFQIDRTTVGQIKRRRTWKWLK